MKVSAIFCLATLAVEATKMQQPPTRGEEETPVVPTSSAKPISDSDQLSLLLSMSHSCLVKLGPIAKIPDAQETISTVQVNATYSSVQVLANSAKKTIVGMQNVRAVSSASLAPFNAPLQLLTI